LEKPKKRRKPVDSGSEAEDDEVATDESGDEDDDDTPAAPRPSQRSNKRQKTQQQEEEDTPMEEDTPADDLPALDSERLKAFKSGLTSYLREKRSQSVSLPLLKAFINEGVARLEPFSDAELKSAIDVMTKANQVMLADDILFLI
jgi:hypothetical protein